MTKYEVDAVVTLLMSNLNLTSCVPLTDFTLSSKRLFTGASHRPYIARLWGLGSVLRQHSRLGGGRSA